MRVITVSLRPDESVNNDVLVVCCFKQGQASIYLQFAPHKLRDHYPSDHNSRSSEKSKLQPPIIYRVFG